MLRIRLFGGSDIDDICDYCRKQIDGMEIVSLSLSARHAQDNAWIQVHTKCLEKQIAKQRNPPRKAESPADGADLSTGTVGGSVPNPERKTV